MDIHARLLQTVEANDPQFEVLLSNAIKAEIAKLEEELRVKRNRNQRKRDELGFVLERRQNLKKSIEEKTKLAESMRLATYCLQDYSKTLLEKLEMMKNRLDEDSLKKLRKIEEAEKLKDKYQKKWEEYEEQFEALPLAKERKIAKEELRKIEIQLEIVKTNIKVMEKKIRDYEKIQEIQLQNDIIQIAQMWIKYRDNVENIKKLRQEDAEFKVKIVEQERKIEELIKEKECEERQKALARFQMPPPIMDQTLMESIMSQYSQPSPKVVQKRRITQPYGLTYKNRNKESLDDFDSASIFSSLSDMSIAETSNSVDAQEIEQVRNDADAVSLSSNQDHEFATGSNQQNIMIRSAERSPQDLLKSPAKSAAGPSPIPVRKTKIEKLVLERSETSKRPANSPQESKIRKKPHEENLKTMINSKENTQEKSALDLETIKTIQENLRKQEMSNTPKKIVREVKAVSQDNCVLPGVMEIDELSSGMENNPENTSVLSPHLSFTESVNSFSLHEQNNNERDTEFDLNSDISMQSNLDDLNNSLNFSEDESSRKDNNNTNAVNPAPPASVPVGIFANQNKGFFNFKGFFPK